MAAHQFANQNKITMNTQMIHDFGLYRGQEIHFDVILCLDALLIRKFQVGCYI